MHVRRWVRLSMIHFLLSFYFQAYVAAAPALNEFTHRADPLSSSQDGCDRRLMFSIVWGCLSTIFLCAWVSVHPNIPKQRRLEGILRRFQFLFWMLVAPDLILVLAMRQWTAAGRIADTYNNTKLKAAKNRRLSTVIYTTIDSWLYLFWFLVPTWTRAHGHFIVMGGLTLVSPSTEEKDTNQNEPEYSDPIGEVMSYEHFLQFVNDPSFDFPIMTEADINDRTRGDMLSKSIAVLQATWFVVQCITRGIQRLAVTELELTTLGFCSVSLVTYIFWWHKPLDAKTQIRVYLKPGQSPLKKDDDADSFDSTTGIWGQRSRRRILDLITNRVAAIRASFRFNSKESLTASILSEFFLIPLILLCLCAILLLSPILLLTSGLANMILTTTVPTGASHVPPAYTPNMGDAIPRATFTIFAAIFGGIHLIGWNFLYPTLIERTLWRVSALLITVIPIYVTLTEELLVYIDKRGRGRIFVPFLVCSGLFFLLTYIFARVSLIAQSFVLLRSQPKSAFVPVDWVAFFPHLA